MKPKRRMDEESPEGTDEEKGEAQIAQLETAFLKETLKELGNIFFMGEVNEEAANGLVSSLITYKELIEKSSAESQELEEEEEPEVSVEAVEGAEAPEATTEEPEEEEEEVQKEPDPIKLYISTQGGNADDMFAIYDVIELVKRTVPIQTIGLGKVMSAGVLILAAGTKGKRRIGKNCRVMIHSVAGGNVGSFHNLENEMEEIRHIQRTYIKLLAAETKMTEAQLKKMINKKINVYLSAEEAVELGIADEVF